ncbi:MAG: hypothetical protein CR975_06740 [Gammaproteobacteria bacterium]|nr:MAG: hypothetical protein CR975_06740 [Gammaproteobacteria bacterium]
MKQKSENTALYAKAMNLVQGTNQDDNLYAGKDGSEIKGLDGNDRLWGNLGDDDLDGGAGNDYLDGKEGNDKLWGRAGDDNLNGGDGNDYLKGGSGNDNLWGGNDNDGLSGSDGDDYLSGGDGDDRLRGDADNDNLRGGNGNDHLNGNAGNDYLWGDNGNDLLSGSDGNDYLNGGDGDDRLFGNAGYDYLYGNSGNDTYLFNRGFGKDIINNYDPDENARDIIQFAEGLLQSDFIFSRYSYDLIIAAKTGGDGLIIQNYFDKLGSYQIDEIIFSDGSKLDVQAVKALVLQATQQDDRLYADDDGAEISGLGGNDSLYGGTGNDRLNGGSGDDSLWGGGGDDYLYGGTGRDTLGGGSGDDILWGSHDDDYLYGHEGDDTLIGGTDNDSLWGGDGDDGLWGGAGNDILSGGTGNDTLTGGTGDDIFVFDTALGDNNIDRISNLETGDKIQLSEVIFTEIDAVTADNFVVGTTATDADDRIIYDRTNGDLYYDADGNGAGTAIKFVSIADDTDISHTQFII